jgi:CBS domain-containing protein
MQLKEVMTRQVEVIRPETPIQEAAKKMQALDVGILPVCDGDRLVGMVTDRDITLRATAEGRDDTHTTASEVMTPKVEYCFEDEDVEEAARHMSQRQIRRLVVLNRQKRLVGIVSLGDLATDTQDTALAGNVLERVSQPAQPRIQ